MCITQIVLRINVLLVLGGLLGNIFFGFITTSFGRRLPLILISIPVIVGSILIISIISGATEVYSQRKVIPYLKTSAVKVQVVDE